MPRSSVISVGANGWADRAAELKGTGRNTVLSFYKQWWRDVTFFHRDGHAYVMRDVRPARPLRALDGILARTIYNPFIEFAYEYERGPAYPLDRLRDAVRHAIEQDDDILTQFRDASELLARLEQAKSFDDVVAVLELAETPEDAA
jgi:hypothetical protein